MIQTRKPFSDLNTDRPERINTSQICISHDSPFEQPDFLLSLDISTWCCLGVGGQFHPQTIDPRDVQIHVPPANDDLRQEEAVNEHDGDEVLVVFAGFAKQFEEAEMGNYMYIP